MRTNKSRGWMTLGLIGLISAGLASCTTDSKESANDGQEVATAFVRGTNSYTPSGTINYLEVVQDLSAEADLSRAVELGQNILVYSIGSHPFTVNGNAKTITKWNVDKKTLKLSVNSVLSYASTGLTSATVVFVSETSAFINDLAEGVVVEFNPGTMEITKTHDVPPLEVHSNFSAFYNGYSSNGKLIFPIRWQPVACCEYPDPLYATVGVFDPATGTLTYEIDERSIAINSILYADENNSVFLLPNSFNAWINHFYNANQNGFSVFKLNTNGTIDSSYEVNLKDGLPGMTYYNSSSFVYQDIAVFTYSENAIPAGSFADRTAARNTMVFKAVAYNLNTHETKPFTAFDAYGAGVNRKAIIDGKAYFVAYTRTSSGGLDTDLLVQNGLEDFAVISTIKAGDFPYMNKLW